MPGRRVVTAIAAVASGLILASCASGSQAAGGSWTAVSDIPGAAGASFAFDRRRTRPIRRGGATPRSGQLGHAAAWTSTDGRTWTAAADEAAFDQHQMVAVASGKPGFAAVGLTCNTQECSASAAWTSTDGQTWRAAAAIPAAGGMTAHSSAIVAGGPGWVVGGYSFPSGDGPSPVGVWTTTDGSSWTASTVSDPAAGGGGEAALGTDGGVIAAFASNDARMVAVGSVTTSTAHREAVWTSSDAKTWTRSEDSPSFEGGAMNAVAWDGKEFVAVGLDDSGAAAWTSADGSTWDKATAGPGFEGRAAHVVRARGGRPGGRRL